MEVKRAGAKDAVTTTAEKRGAIVLPNTTWTPADPDAYSGGQAAHISHLKELEFAESIEDLERALGLLAKEEEVKALIVIGGAPHEPRPETAHRRTEAQAAVPGIHPIGVVAGILLLSDFHVPQALETGAEGVPTGVSSTDSTRRRPATADWVWSRISVNSATMPSPSKRPAR